ncbi:GNAT family N-acetyltransferase [Paucisalibacillus globulus]|uniref:GNAT family N-acetyltransferase n=1 Tax=Paucisalibacillus globulus TaxID=351095 RepID=UPI001596A313|nr:GNAT family N-acetyltransferase [Paucisalibacillus globulus]
MKSTVIRRPRKKDIIKIQELFRLVVTDTFQKEGIAELLDDIEEEIQTKITYLNQDIGTGGTDRYFLIAEVDEKIIGTIEFGPASDLIKKWTNDAFRSLYEVGTVFVHPSYQSKGIGNQLLNEIYVALQNRGAQEFCLDSGYKRSQTIWRKKFGEPDYVITDLWGDGAHHMIWRVTLL